jgi:hypothetical protein
MSQGGKLSCTDITRAVVCVRLTTIANGAKNVLMIYDAIVTISTISPSVNLGNAEVMDGSRVMAYFL